MMQKTSWFFEVEGQMQGPYTSEQIQKFVMEGSLKVEARIFNSDANQWCVAADLFPQFGLGQPQPGQKGWQPPPRPSSINKHVVSESGDEPSALIDYFELLGVAKKTNYIPSPQANKHAASVSEKLSSKASEINLTEELASASEVFKNTGMFFVQIKRPLYYAATLALVFGGSYGLFRSFSNSNQRTPAAAATSVTAQPQVVTSAPSAAQPVRGQELRMSGSSQVGSGTNRVKRPSGSAGQNAMAVPTLRPTETPQVERTYDGETAGRTYYSSAEEEAQHAAAPQPNAVPAQPAENGAVENDIVNPPGYMPVQEGSPGNPPPDANQQPGL